MPATAISIETAADAVADERVQAFGVLLTAAARLERLLGLAMERESGISHAMFEVLLRLAAAPDGVTMGDLSRDAVLTSGGATRLVDRMVDAGLVLRRRSRTDRRIKVVTITPLGERKLAEAAQRHARAIDEHVFQVLEPEQLAATVAGLDRLGHHAEEALPPLG
ncbi:MarR family winged helix-turn-helix transcriptional regulator [Streptacidiphilus jiangxiensis]|uniref:DNA-binding transcriptional regulator, MarR family n=1 Tax=Streptacidiphilus jiangxiensis TaxID=235985 RepID=A0A1H7LBA5_STRJI|nr:MarR family winged helix-turn-helix transcriptional regulator [Streptacidiphilus jiangxiensis]SEK96252.1 DNA-binding transcriptional regulator, MarR family [Streptacidiphilus jiangxiensis]